MKLLSKLFFWALFDSKILPGSTLFERERRACLNWAWFKWKDKRIRYGEIGYSVFMNIFCLLPPFLLLFLYNTIYIFVSNCWMYLSQIVKWRLRVYQIWADNRGHCKKYLLKLVNGFVSNCKMKVAQCTCIRYELTTFKKGDTASSAVLSKKDVKLDK